MEETGEVCVLRQGVHRLQSCYDKIVDCNIFKFLVEQSLCVWTKCFRRRTPIEYILL